MSTLSSTGRRLARRHVRHGVLKLLAWLLLCASGTQASLAAEVPAIRTFAEAGMPPLSSSTEAMQGFYKMRFLADGYPGRADGFAHPIYGTYVLTDYEGQYAAAPSAALKSGIEKVALAVIARMEVFRGSLVFWYPVDNIARNLKRHYSGLTQAYYANCLYQAFLITGNARLRDASQQVYESLKIPAADGGVYFSDSHGVTIAEVPQQPNSWILNGWLSVLVALDHYAQMTKSADAAQLLRANLESLRYKLPLYDNPRYRISNYGLTGFAYARIRFKAPEIIEHLGTFSYEIPGEGRFELPPGPVGRWSYSYFAQDLAADGRPKGKVVTMNLVMSKASAPLENVLSFATTAGKSTSAVLEIQTGDYVPTASASGNTRWQAIANIEIPAGSHVNEVAIPWNEDTLAVIYPTNFVKRIRDRNVNVYHSIHINKLMRLYRRYGMAEFKQWAETWTEDICAWRDMHLYDGLYVYSVDTRRTVEQGALPHEVICR